MSQNKEKLQAIREACEADLRTYISVIMPSRVVGAIHEELIGWWERQDAKNNQLVLLPRAHQKSQLVAFRTAWRLVKDPTLQILYVSATIDLAAEQLSLIKSILESPTHQLLWPDLIHPEEGKREKWASEEIKVDHPKRKEEGVRDPSIKAAGLTTNITGFHADIVVLDDIVVPNNAYTTDGRSKVARLYSQLASIENPGAEEWVVGTRYHPKDIYQTLLDMTEMVMNDEGEVVGENNVYEVFQRVVEINGEFLWPKTRRKDGKYFGFDWPELNRIKAKYVDTTQFFAQYYNDPNDPENSQVDPSKFQYYEKKNVEHIEGIWYHRDKPLNVVAAIDFAFSTAAKADWTAIIVIGMDPEGFIYVLDIDRFKTDRIAEYYEHIFRLYAKWNFKKIRAEVTVAQQAIVRDLKDNYIRPNGLNLFVDEYRPNRHEGRKEERIAATLIPKYDMLSVYHYRGGNCQLLEEELLQAKPEHDDIIDVFTAALDIVKAPINRRMAKKENKVIYHSRFGGVSYA